jgi:cobalamin biosynthesis protein CbiG
MPRRGRPRKFTAPSRAVTLTLPEDVLAALDAVDHDLSRAVVRVTQPQMAKRPHPPAELATFGRRAVIVVNPSRTLEKRTGIVLVPLSDGRALISFDESMTVARLELRIQDALEDQELPPEDARIFKSIAEILKTARRSGDVTLQQRHIIMLESNPPPRRRAPPGVPKRRG